MEQTPHITKNDDTPLDAHISFEVWTAFSVSFCFSCHLYNYILFFASYLILYPGFDLMKYC